MHIPFNFVICNVLTSDTEGLFSIPRDKAYMCVCVLCVCLSVSVCVWLCVCVCVFVRVNAHAWIIHFNLIKPMLPGGSDIS